jgi:hypothetical protein
MASTQVAPVVSLLTTVGISVVVVGAIGFVAAKRFGGQSRAKRQLVFFLVSAVGLLGIAGYIYSRMSAHAQRQPPAA